VGANTDVIGARPTDKLPEVFGGIDRRRHRRPDGVAVRRPTSFRDDNGPAARRRRPLFVTLSIASECAVSYITETLTLPVKRLSASVEPFLSRPRRSSILNERSSS